MAIRSSIPASIKIWNGTIVQTAHTTSSPSAQHALSKCNTSCGDSVRLACTKSQKMARVCGGSDAAAEEG